LFDLAPEPGLCSLTDRVLDASDLWLARLCAGWLHRFGVVAGLVTPADARSGVEHRGTAPWTDLSDLAALLRNRDLLGVLLGFCFDYFWYLLLTWLPSYPVNVRHLTLQGRPFRGAAHDGFWLVPAARWMDGGPFDPARVERGAHSQRDHQRAFPHGPVRDCSRECDERNVAVVLFMGGCPVGLNG
jgi:hypothetical protein